MTIVEFLREWGSMHWSTHKRDEGDQHAKKRDGPKRDNEQWSHYSLFIVACLALHYTHILNILQLANKKKYRMHHLHCQGSTCVEIGWQSTNPKCWIGSSIYFLLDAHPINGYKLDAKIILQKIKTCNIKSMLFMFSWHACGACLTSYKALHKQNTICFWPFMENLGCYFT